MKVNAMEENIDPRLVQKIMLLRHTPPRDPEAASVGRKKYITELEGLFPEEKSDIRMSLSPIIESFLYWIKGNSMFVSSTRTLARALVAVIAVLVLVFGGVSVTAQASRSALPGDALYLIKTGLEQAQISFAKDLSREAELYMHFASIRLQEIQKLVEAGRYEDAIALSEEFQSYMQKALQAVAQLSVVDPEKASELNADIISKLSTYNQQLGTLLSNLPEGVKYQFPSDVPGNNLAAPTEENENLNDNENINENVNANDNEQIEVENQNENDDRDGIDNQNDDSGQNDNGSESIDQETESDHEGIQNDSETEDSGSIFEDGSVDHEGDPSEGSSSGSDTSVVFRDLSQA